MSLCRIAILSDVHGNLPALEAVLEEIGRAGPDEVWSLGDVVGYGAQPDECARLVEQSCALRLVGNHDLAVLGELDVSAFSPVAAEAVEWTRANAAPETLDTLRDLEPSCTSREVALYHASPRDPVWEYVLYADQAGECMALQDSRVSFIGHSHVALYFVAAGDGAPPPPGVEPHGAQAGADTVLELDEGRWLVNPGSVGQPRDGDPRAAWMELDTGAWTATYRRVAYDIDRAAEAIEAAGLPRHLARRLYVGT